jgi:hypothetical protein
MRQPGKYPEELKDQRVVKLLLPLAIIRQMDGLLLDGIGGFTTRNELVREAIESYMLELTHEPAPAEPTPISARKRQLRPVAPTPTEATVAPPPDSTLTIADTALRSAASGGATIRGEAEVVEEPLFGMHNRDYPSLWAARRLLVYLDEGAITFEEFAERATEEAWAYAAELRALELELETKLTALFPTNVDKREAASGAFRAFALGSIALNGTAIRADGPLFLWRVIDVERHDAAVAVGLRREGRELLARLSGLTVAQPHAPELARTFLAHLEEHAPADYWGFGHVLSTVAERPTRLELVDAFQQARPDWRESVAATNAQGYVARGREWGLIAPKVVDGRYELTDFGVDVLRGGPSE